MRAERSSASALTGDSCGIHEDSEVTFESELVSLISSHAPAYPGGTRVRADERCTTAGWAGPHVVVWAARVRCVVWDSGGRENSRLASIQWLTDKQRRN